MQSFVTDAIVLSAGTLFGLLRRCQCNVVINFNFIFLLQGSFLLCTRLKSVSVLQRSSWRSNGRIFARFLSVDSSVCLQGAFCGNVRTQWRSKHWMHGECSPRAPQLLLYRQKPKLLHAYRNCCVAISQ